MILFLCSWLHAKPQSLAPVVDAFQKEMNRGLELALENQPTPYWIEGNILDIHTSRTSTSNGELLYQNTSEIRRIRIDVRVGDSTFDNSNLDSYGYRGVVMTWLPLEDEPLALRRSIWLGIDRAYKDAVDTYAQKEAAWDNRIYPERPEMLSLTSINSIDSTDKVESLSMTWAQELSASLSTVWRDYDNLEYNEVLVSEQQVLEDTINTEGLHTSQSHSLYIIRAEVIAKAEDGNPLRDTRSWVFNDRESIISTQEMQQELVEMADWITTLQTAPIEDSYLGPVIFEGRAATEIFRQLLQSQISGTPPAAPIPDADGSIPQSIPLSRIGRRVLPVGWTVIDDANTEKQLPGHYTFDAQGVRPQRVELITSGVVQNLLMSRIPRETSTMSTGHARAVGSERFIAFPSIVTVEPKKHVSTQRLIRKGLQLSSQTGSEYILVVKYIEPFALTENFEIAFSGDEQLSGLTTPTVVVRRYADGHEEPVRGLRFVGVDRRVLKDIVLAGPQEDFIGMTDDSNGRYGLGPTSGQPVSWSVPSVLIEEVEMSGQGGGEQRILPPPTN